MRFAQDNQMVNPLATNRFDQFSAKPFCQGEPGAMGLSRSASLDHILTTLD